MPCEVKQFIKQFHRDNVVAPTQRFIVYVYNHGNEVIEDKTVGCLEAAIGYSVAARRRYKKETPEFKPLFVIQPVPQTSTIDLTDDLKETL